MRLALSLVFAFFLLAAPFTAGVSAQRVNAPPGLSGVDEYLETVPGVGGAERPGAASGPQGRPLTPEEADGRVRGTLSAKVLRDLEDAGEDGEALKRLIAANRPARGAVAGQTLSGGQGGGGAAGSVSAVLTGEAGAGIVFPLGLIAATLVLFIAALKRRRSA